MRYLNQFLALFRSEARTVGLSPKALAPLIGAGVTGILAAVGLTPAEIGGWIGVNDAVVAAGLVTVTAKIAAYLLGPGIVVRAAPEIDGGSDSRLDPAAIKAIGRDT